MPSACYAALRRAEGIALQIRVGLNPLLAQCHLGLGKLSRPVGKRQEAREHFTTAATMLRDMDMRFWLARAEAELAALGGGPRCHGLPVDGGAPCGHNDYNFDPGRPVMTRSVGARELKTRLGTYIEQVRRGVTLIVTERGEPVAELRPIGRKRDDEASRLEALRARGLLTRQSRARLAPFRPIRIAGPGLARAVIEDRADRF